MNNEVILVVDDDAGILALAQDHLSREGYRVVGAMTGEDALYKAQKHTPDLILLAPILPGVHGFEIYHRLKNDERIPIVPIILLSGKGEEASAVTLLELGADDYVSKPFEPGVLLSRVRAVLDREATETSNHDSPITIHDVVLYPSQHELTVNGETIRLTFTEFSVLHCLARRPGTVFTRSQIVEFVRGENYDVTVRAVDVQITSLRKKLGDAGPYIETMRGVGYRFRE